MFLIKKYNLATIVLGIVVAMYITDEFLINNKTNNIMTDFISNDQIVSAAKNDIDTHIENGTFKGYEGTTKNDQENFYSITSLYTQWARNESEADLALNNMYVEYYPEYNETLN